MPGIHADCRRCSCPTLSAGLTKPALKKSLAPEDGLFFILTVQLKLESTTLSSHRLLDWNGLQLSHYHLPPAGGAPDQGPPLLWLHANGYGARTYTPLLTALAQAGHSVHALDFVGHGYSSATTRFENWFFFRDQVLALLQELELPEVRLIGHSLGGATSLLTAAELERRAQAGDASVTRVAALCLLDPTVFTPWLMRIMPFFPNEMAAGAEARRSVFKSRKVVARSYRMHPGFKNWRDDVFEAYLDCALRETPDGQFELVLPPAVEAQIFRTLKPGYWPHNRQVSAPMLIVQESGQGVCPDRARRLLMKPNPASRGFRHSHGSHFFPMEDPDGTVAAIREFLDGLPARTR